jgi:hypothetical protein
MNWILVIVIYSSIGSPIPAVTSIAMDTEAACHAAGVKAVADLQHKGNAIKFICSRKSL